MTVCSQCNGEMDKTQMECPHCGVKQCVSAPKRSWLSRTIEVCLWTCFLLAGPLGLFSIFAWPSFLKTDFFRTVVYPYVSPVPPQTYFDTAPPELGPAERWFNTDEPVTIASLRGNVVWVEFSFSNCGGCIAMKPQLAQWHRVSDHRCSQRQCRPAISR